jgi:hypothetical protein
MNSGTRYPGDMFLAIVALATMADLIPARWAFNEPATLDLVKRTPVNCLLVEQGQWSRAFNEDAAKRGITTLAVIRPQPGALEAAGRISDLHFHGAVLEGSFDPALRTALRELLSGGKLSIVELTPRGEMNLDGSAAVIGTDQGVWPGIQIEEDGKAKAAPSGAAWIDTNTGFLRYVRASTTATIWLANQPPKGQEFTAERYIQAVGDAAMAGARWVLSFDDQFMRKLLAGDKKTVEGWRRIGKVIEFYESHQDWRSAQPFAQLALVEDANSGALLSGGILDMIATKHTPVRPVPKDRLDAKTLSASQLAVNVDPDALTPSQRDVLKAFTRSGGTLLTGPPGWKFPMPREGQITLEKDDLKKLDDIWRELNSLTGRKNLGARLFNVSSMLSNVLELPSRNEVLIHLVNYSDFPIENVTVHVLGKYTSAALYRPDAGPIPVSGYEVEEGTGYDIDQVGTVATLVLKR